MLNNGIVTVNPRHQEVIDNLAAGHGLTKSAQMAGYNTSAFTRDLMPKVLEPAVRAYMRRHVRGKLDVEAAPEAYALLRRMMNDEETGKTLRIDIAKYLLSHSIAAPKAAEENVDNEKEPHEMTDEELQALIRKTDAELMQRGQLIDASPKQRIDDLI